MSAVLFHAIVDQDFIYNSDTEYIAFHNVKCKFYTKSIFSVHIAFLILFLWQQETVKSAPSDFVLKKDVMGKTVDLYTHR